MSSNYLISMHYTWLLHLSGLDKRKSLKKYLLITCLAHKMRTRCLSSNLVQKIQLYQTLLPDSQRSWGSLMSTAISPYLASYEAQHEFNHLSLQSQDLCKDDSSLAPGASMSEVQPPCDSLLGGSWATWRCSANSQQTWE